MPKALEVVPVAILLGAQHSYQKSLIVINVWKTGIHAKYVILLKYKTYP